MSKLVFNSETSEMEEVELSAEELVQREIDKNSEIPQLPPSLDEQLAEKDKQIVELKKLQSVTSAFLSELNETQQDMIELIMEMGNV